MAKYSSSKGRRIKEIVEFAKKEPLPIFYLFGEDKFAIERATALLEKAFSKYVLSDFDKETFHASKTNTVEEIINLALGFPFGGGKKIIKVKQFNLIKEKKALTDYIENPADFTILIIIDDSDSVNTNRQPFKALKEKGYLFEAKKISGAEWITWIKSRANELKISIDTENAQLLLEIVGEEKQLLMRQLEKFRDYSGEGGKIEKEHILKLASSTKEYSTFDLQDAFLRGDKKRLLTIGFHLLDNGKKLFEILPIFTSALYILTQHLELKHSGLGAAEAGANPYYYRKITSSPYFTNEKRIKKAVELLLQTDKAVKTSQGDHKNLFLQFVSSLFE